LSTGNQLKTADSSSPVQADMIPFATMNKSTQRMIEISSPLFIDLKDVTEPIIWKEVFGNNNPLALEIGCGIGDFIAKTALENPDINFIAIDYYNKGCDKTCRRLEKLAVSNVRVLRVEAREFITDRIPPGSLTALYINCPDPWPKKRHRKRRLVNSTFMDFMRDYLMPAADFFFATDFDDYGLDVAAMMAERNDYTNMLAPDLYRFDLEGYHRSKYMLKFMEEGKPIHFVHYRKI
jgi:tRNA (guanine-N7-)-methyltransferase